MPHDAPTAHAHVGGLCCVAVRRLPRPLPSRSLDGRDRDGSSAQADERAISLDEAVAQAERRYKARAVRAEEKRHGDRIEYRIRLLAKDGRVFEVRIDAAYRPRRLKPGEPAMRLLVLEDEPALRETLAHSSGKRASPSTWRRTASKANSPALEYPDRRRSRGPRLAGPLRPRRDPRLAQGRQGLSGADPDGARQLAGKGHGPRRRRGRLRHQAIPFRGSAGARAGAAAPVRRLVAAAA